MAEPATGLASGQRALDEPTVPVRKRWIAALALATMGLFMASNIAVAGPAAVGGLLAALLVTLGHYPTLFASTAITAAIGAILVWRIKSVR